MLLIYFFTDQSFFGSLRNNFVKYLRAGMEGGHYVIIKDKTNSRATLNYLKHFNVLQ